MISRFKQNFQSCTSEMQGILWMLYACFWFACMASLIRHITSTLDPFVVVFFRNLFAFLCILPWAYKYGFSKIRTKRWNLYATRVVSGVIGMSFIFYAISKLPLTHVTSLTFTVPLISTFFAAFFLGEKVKTYQVLALLAGFIGILVIVRPGTDDFQLTSLIAIGATCCWSVSNILVKKLTTTDHPKTIVFLMITLITPCSLPAAIYSWQTPDLKQLFWLLILGWVSNQAQFSMTHAYSKADISVVLPFDFSRLVFISILAYIFFGEVIDAWTFAGASMIFVSSIYAAGKQRRKPVIDPSDNLV